VSAEIVIEVPAWGTATPIQLLWDEAPETCEAICRALPIEKPAFHARRSGKELFVLTDPFKLPPHENRRLQLHDGDVLFIHFPPTWTDDHPDFTRSADGIFDIALIYGEDALLRGPDAPVEGSLFGRITPDHREKFRSICRRMWMEGTQDVVLRRADGS